MIVLGSDQTLACTVLELEEDLDIQTDGHLTAIHSVTADVWLLRQLFTSFLIQKIWPWLLLNILSQFNSKSEWIESNYHISKPREESQNWDENLDFLGEWLINLHTNRFQKNMGSIEG